MIVKKHEFIVGFIIYIIKLLEKSLPEEGFELDMLEKAKEAITDKCGHSI